MALIFQRLARNFVKKGYYPTDGETISRINQGLSFSGKACTMLDPCCGEGTALAEIANAVTSLETGDVSTYGVEYDQERAWHSKQILNHSIHGDLRNCMIGARQFGLLFLNPPYGDAVSDKAQLSSKSGKLRLEKEFYRRTNGLLQFGGIIVLVVPYYVLDVEYSTWISRHFHDVQIYMAPEQQFKQAVIFGVRHKVTDRWSYTEEYSSTLAHLVSVGHGDVMPDELPKVWDRNPKFGDGDGFYHIPDSGGSEQTGRFELSRLDGKQLALSFGKEPGLWKQYQTLFGQHKTLKHKRPMCDVSNWHLSLMLAAGQVSGVVNSNDGRIFVVRGNTYKNKRVETSQTDLGDGELEMVKTSTDVFIPAIRALNMTPGSASFGDVFTIK